MCGRVSSISFITLLCYALIETPIIHAISTNSSSQEVEYAMEHSESLWYSTVAWITEWTNPVSHEIGDCCSDAEIVQRINRHHIRPSLDELVQTKYFRFFKVDLSKHCPFWPDDGQCARVACSVCVCDPQDVPYAWRREIEFPQVSTFDGCPEDYASPYAQQLAKVAASHEKVGRDFEAWQMSEGPEEKNVWSFQDEKSENLQYVDLLVNPEGYTGYDGPNARRLWEAIYSENCFEGGPEDLCFEERVFFRLLSGLQSSINTHISLTRNDGAPDLAMWQERVGNHPQRIKNLFFTYLFVVRAVIKAENLLRMNSIDTGNPMEDARTHELIHHLFEIDEPSVTSGFDESLMFKVRISEIDMPEVLKDEKDMEKLQQHVYHQLAFKMDLKEQFRTKYRNISRIMDCVGCEKCRLWGKLQFLGLGTALKVLFVDENTFQSQTTSTVTGISVAQDDEPTFKLERNEIVALMNVLHRLSISVDAVQAFRHMETEQSLLRSGELFVGAFMIGLFLFVAARMMQHLCSRSHSSHSKTE